MQNQTKCDLDHCDFHRNRYEYRGIDLWKVYFPIPFFINSLLQIRGAVGKFCQWGGRNNPGQSLNISSETDLN